MTTLSLTKDIPTSLPNPPHIFPIFRSLFEQLSRTTCDTPHTTITLPRIIHTNPSLEPLLKRIYEKFEQKVPTIIATPQVNISSPHVSQSHHNCLIGFTGGKDSTYMAIQLKHLFHLSPILVYVEGINRCYPSERRIATEMSEKLNMPLVIVSLLHTGKSPFLSNPVKNGVILSLLYDMGLQLGISTFSLGTHTHTTIASTNQLSTISDSKEFIDACNTFMQQWIPTLQYMAIDVPINEIYKCLHSHGLLPHIQSCIATHRYRTYLRCHNIAKFGIIQPLPNRCYSCYKCCTEYLILHSMDMVGAINQPLYHHCIDIIRSKWEFIAIPNKPKNPSQLEIIDIITHKN